MSNRKIRTVTRGTGQHWVGDGFHVHNFFTWDSALQTSPFLLLDYAAPFEFAPADTPRGIGMHPHRGFETVTIVYEGEVEHQDTAGNKGKISPGDVQWMTAARGILHEERHSTAFTKNGGKLEMVQLWVNLPAKYKMSAPGYQEISGKNIPSVKLKNDSGSVRVIAGEFAGIQGIAKTFTSVNLYDIRLKKDALLNIFVKPGFNALLLVLDGKIRVEDKLIPAAELISFAADNDTVELVAVNDAKLLFMSGEPINEPIVGEGPFVMNTEAEILQALSDFHSGKLG